MRYVILLPFLLPAVSGSGQNLVPNGSFEGYTDCPDDGNQLGGNVTGWVTSANSPDFFHACRDSSDLGVPFNWVGYQQPSQGDGYAGVITYKWNAPFYREYVSAQFADPLVPGVPVDLSMKVALGGYGSYWLNSPRWTSKGIGMRLSTHPYSWSFGSVYPNTAQLYMDAVFTDTVSWVLLNISYVPDSAYQFVTIGNFFEDSLSAPMLLDTVFGNLNSAYVFVDEVCITPAGMACDFASTVMPIDTEKWRISTPFSEGLEITFPKLVEQRMELVLYDANGRAVQRRIVPSGVMQVHWALPGLANGLYVVHTNERSLGFKPLRVLHVSP